MPDARAARGSEVTPHDMPPGYVMNRLNVMKLNGIFARHGVSTEIREGIRLWTIGHLRATGEIFPEKGKLAVYLDSLPGMTVPAKMELYKFIPTHALVVKEKAGKLAPTKEKPRGRTPKGD